MFRVLKEVWLSFLALAVPSLAVYLMDRFLGEYEFLSLFWYIGCLLIPFAYAAVLPLYLGYRINQKHRLSFWEKLKTCLLILPVVPLVFTLPCLGEIHSSSEPVFRYSLGCSASFLVFYSTTLFLPVLHPQYQLKHPSVRLLYQARYFLLYFSVMLLLFFSGYSGCWDPWEWISVVYVPMLFSVHIAIPAFAWAIQKQHGNSSKDRKRLSLVVFAVLLIFWGTVLPASFQDKTVPFLILIVCIASVLDALLFFAVSGDANGDANGDTNGGTGVKAK